MSLSSNQSNLHRAAPTHADAISDKTSQRLFSKIGPVLGRFMKRHWGAMILVLALFVFGQQWYFGYEEKCTVPSGFTSYVGSATSADGDLNIIHSIYMDGSGSGNLFLLFVTRCGSPDKTFVTKQNYQITTSDGRSIILSKAVIQVIKPQNSSPLALKP